MGYSARRGFTNGKISGAARQAELQQKIAAMQEKMTEAQDAVEAQEFTASVGGGVVEAKVNGKKEVLSVIIQVTYFKKTGGKRIFKMAPIHHHFELCGWSETRVVAVFSIVTAILCLVAYMGL